MRFDGRGLERLLLFMLNVCSSCKFLNFVGNVLVNLLLNNVMFCRVVIVVSDVGMELEMLLLWRLSFWRFISFLILVVIVFFNFFVGRVMEMMCFCVYLMFI